MTALPTNGKAESPTPSTDRVIQESTNTPIHDLLMHAHNLERALRSIADLTDDATALEDQEIVGRVRIVACAALRGPEGGDIA